MIDSVSGSLPPNAALSAARVEDQKIQAQDPVLKIQDTVEISEYAQARLLHDQGQNLTQIMLVTGLDQKTISEYLGL